jgi:hypothetical protein
MFPVGFLAEVLIGVLIEMLGYGIARLIIPLLTFGTVRLDPLSASSEHYNWLGYRRDGARMVLGPTTAGLIGILIFIGAVIALVFGMIEPT